MHLCRSHFCHQQRQPPELKGASQRYSQRLGKFRGLVVDVCHPHADRGGARVRLDSAVRHHHHKLVEMVGPFIVQTARREDGPMRWDAEVRAQGVIRELSVGARVTVCGQNWWEGQSHHQNQFTVCWTGAKRWWICRHLCILWFLYGLANIWWITASDSYD